MRQLFDYDMETGIAHYTEDEEIAGRLTTAVRMCENVEPIIEEAHRQQVSGERDQGIEGHMKHYCYLPLTLMIELKKKGINMMRPSNEDWRRFFMEIETNYPKLKTTEMKAWRPGG